MICFATQIARTQCIEYWARQGEPGLQTVLGRRVYRAMVLEGPAFTLGFSADPAFGVTAPLATIGAAREYDPIRRATVSAIWGFWAQGDVLRRHLRPLLAAMKRLLAAEAEASRILQALAADARAARFIAHFGFAPTGRSELGLDVYETGGL
jgi:hypothetical protein